MKWINGINRDFINWKKKKDNSNLLGLDKIYAFNSSLRKFKIHESCLTFSLYVWIAGRSSDEHESLRDIR